jgi:hypothetical protein
VKNQLYLCRLPFRSGDGSIRYSVMGEMIDEYDEHDMKTPVANEALTDTNKLPFCVDCLGALGWAEAVYGLGARKCMHCGSVFLVVESESNGIIEGLV